MTEEENKKTESEGKEMMDAEHYLELVKNLKENSVSKEEYDRVLSENKKLADTIANGGGMKSVKEVAKPTIDELRKNYLKPNQTNLEYAKNVLALRNAIIEKKPNEDPFLPKGHELNPTEFDRISAQSVADCLQECIDIADGNSESFTIALQNRMEDIKIPKRK